MTNPKHLVVVLGMHRGGTSAITRSLPTLGIHLGDKLIAAQSDNPKGFWEDSHLVELNLQLFASAHTYSNHLTPISQKQIDQLLTLPIAQDAASLIQERLQEHAHFAIKDPRLPRLLRFWRPLLASLDIKVSYVIALRNPLSVVKSLQKREPLKTSYCYLLWLVHMIDCLELLDEPNSIVVNYENLMADPDLEIKRMSEGLQLPIMQSELEEYKSQFLDYGMRNTLFTLDDLDHQPECPPIVRDTYQTLLVHAEDQNLPAQVHSSVLLKRMRDLTPSFQFIDQTESARFELENKLSNDQLILAQRDASISELQSTLLEREESISTLQSSLCKQNEAISIKDDKILRMQNSYSWKCTAPFRALRRLIVQK